MKKIVKRIFLVLLVVVTAYTAAATVLVHGVSVYRLNSRLGAVLAISRQVTLLAAVVLWIAALILLGRWIAARRKNRAQAKFPAGAAVQAGPAKGRKNRKKLMGKPAAAADKIPPQGRCGTSARSLCGGGHSAQERNHAHARRCAGRFPRRPDDAHAGRFPHRPHHAHACR